ncbi:dihydrofolate reductase family protein [Gordonia crocea]|uniref:Diacylglycerol kinase n=1 Tax=Gordonia crocea TaxID=589162 RepID=A0A7M3SU85_9ACTN|nr:dihydrofolate reductase family protein [Gordonia crocea]GED96209.1 diacylglycerol kinase [Gordonia crocea]
MSELIYLVAVSLDGFIAGPDHQFSEFATEGDHMDDLFERYPDALPTQLAAHLGLDQAAGRFSAVVMGAQTYAMGLPETTSPYPHLDQFVFSHRDHAPAENVTFTDEEPSDVVRRLKSKDVGDVWLCGGSNLAGQLADEIDRVIVKRHPVVFGAGRPLFAGEYRPIRFERLATRSFTSSVEVTEFVPVGPRR